MRKWIGGLHGGQLVMLVVPVMLVGVTLLWASHGLFTRADGWIANAAKLPLSADSVSRAASLALATQDGSLGLRFLGAGLLVCLVPVPMLWWWFGAREKPNG